MQISFHLHFSLLTTALLTAIMLSACKDDDAVIGFSVDRTDITIDAQGGSETVSLTADGDWTASVSVPWLSITPANGSGSASLSVRIDTTLTHDVREAEIRLASRTASPIYLKVHQFGYGKCIVTDKDSITVDYSDEPSKRVFTLNVSSNVEFDVNIESTDGSATWITPASYSFTLDRGARPRTTSISFDWNMNVEDHGRDAIIHFVPKNAADRDEAAKTVVVHQLPAPTITDDRAGDSLAVVLINSRLNSMTSIDVTENMMYWNNVELWEATDADLPSRDAIGRIRYVSFALFNTSETVAPEVRHLKYCERLSFYGNVNANLKDITLANDVCEMKHLKHLQIAAYGLVALPDDFYRLGATLETLDLNSNNFSDIPAVITKENFPHLRKLNLSTCRRRTLLDLRNKNEYTSGIGLYINMSRNDNNIRRLFLWDTLEQLALSYNYIEGELPEFTVGEDGIKAYTQADVVEWGGDTIKNMVGRPKVLPHMKDLRLNLNFYTGRLPEWILYHPHLLDWNPESFIFTTQEKGINTSGSYCGFDNVPDDYEYYYNFFPGYRAKYEIIPE